MRTVEKRKEYTLKNGAEYVVIEKIHYSDWGYWTWKQIIPYSEKDSLVITETHGYYYRICHMGAGDSYDSYEICR